MSIESTYIFSKVLRRLAIPALDNQAELSNFIKRLGFDNQAELSNSNISSPGLDNQAELTKYLCLIIKGQEPNNQINQGWKEKLVH